MKDIRVTQDKLQQGLVMIAMITQVVVKSMVWIHCHVDSDVVRISNKTSEPQDVKVSPLLI